VNRRRRQNVEPVHMRLVRTLEPLPENVADGDSGTECDKPLQWCHRRTTTSPRIARHNG